MNVIEDGSQFVHSKRLPYIGEIDSLRAFAMTGVFLQHAGFLPFGWMGVWLFFVVSGYAVCTSVQDELLAQKTTLQIIGIFYAKRAFRIWPLYFAFLFLNAAFLIIIRHPTPLVAIPALASFIENFRMMFVPDNADTGWASFGHLWTISVEQQFYLLFPLVFLQSSERRRTGALLVLAAIAPFARFLWGHWWISGGETAGQSAFSVYAFTPAHLDAFAVGALISLHQRSIAASRRWAFWSGIVAGSYTFIYCSIYATLGFYRNGLHPSEALRNIISGILYGDFRELFVYEVPVFWASFLLISLLEKRRWLSAVTQLRLTRHIGRVSYGGYVLHISCLVTASMLTAHFLPLSHHRVMARIFLLAPTYLMTIVFASLSFRYFERPVARIGRHWIRARPVELT